MEKWTKFGNVLGSHMMFIAPLCVVAGVLFPEQIGHLRPAVTFMFAIMTFQGSLNNTFASLLEVFRHPRNMLAILATTIVAMPVVARLLAGVLFAGNANIVTGITLEYCVPVGVVCFMWVGMYDGNRALALATILTSTVLAPFTIPLALKLLLGETVQVDVWGMMSDMLVMIALPALLGMLVNELTHGWGHRQLSRAMAPATRVLLMLIMAANSTKMSTYIWHLTPELVGSMVFILIYASMGFVLGICLGRLLGVSLPTLVTVCFATGLRNISAGAVLAAQFFPGEVIVPVMMGTLFQQVIAGAAGTLMDRLVASEKARLGSRS